VLAQLAEALGAARLAADGRAPLTAVTRAALVRRALRTAGEVLSGSADQAGLVDLVAAGKTGVKAGQGFRTWSDAEREALERRLDALR